LFGLCRVRADPPDGKSHKHRPAIDQFIVIKVAAPVLEVADPRNASQRPNVRGCEVDVPLVGPRIEPALFLAGEYASAIETYSGRAAYYLDAAAWAALGDRKRALALLRERLGRMSLSRLMTALMSSLLALLEGRTDEAVRLMETVDTTREPEILVYLARHYSRLKLPDSAVRALKQAAQSGFVCAPHTLITDPWLSAVRKHPEFSSLLSAAETLVEQARSSVLSNSGLL
jgi:hypothetical protein